MKDVVLHVGMNKAGSTAIQLALRGLQSDTHIYPDLCGFRNHSVPIVTIFKEDFCDQQRWIKNGIAKSFVADERDKYRSAFNKLLSSKDPRTLIFSGEHVPELSGSELSNLAAEISQHANNVQIYAYVRAPIAHTFSAIQQFIKNDKFESIPEVRYRERFEKFFNVFEPRQINFRLFEKSQLIQQDVVKDFCEWIGLGDIDAKTRQANTSLSTEATQLIYALNKSRAITHGSEAIWKARIRLVLTIRDLFPGKLNIPTSIVRNKLDADDIKWMEDISGLNLNEPDEKNESPDVSIEAFLENISPSSIDTLKDHMNRERIEHVSNNDPRELMARLFEHHLQN